MATDNKQALRTRFSLFFEGKTSLALFQLSLLISLLLLGMMIKSVYEVYRSQSKVGKTVAVLAEKKSSEVQLPTIDLSGARLAPNDDIEPTYAITPFKVKEAAITLIKRGYVRSGIDILKSTPETQKLGIYLENQYSIKTK